MAAGLHGSARTTPRVRAELQASQEATGVLAARYGLNPKTVTKWRKRTTTADQPMGPAKPRSTVLTEAADAMGGGLRRPPPPDRGRGSDGRGVSAPHPAATRRRARLLAREHAQAHPQRTAPLPPATR